MATVTHQAVRGSVSAAAIREAAADLFLKQGYEATSLREIAAVVGIKVGSLYNHISGKEEILSVMMIEVMDDLLSALDRAIADVEDPVEQLKRAMDCHIRFHAVRARDVFIGNSEIRSLGAQDRRKLVRRRDRYEQSIRKVLERAAATGEPSDIDMRLHTYGVLAMGAHVANWYHDGGDLSLSEVISGYTRMILRQLGVPEQVHG